MNLQSLLRWSPGCPARLTLLVLAAIAASTQANAQADSQADSQATTQAAYDSSVATAEQMPRATESLLLDVAATNTGYVAVGERGHVLHSADGNSWQQVADIPTRSTLTAVTSRGNLVWIAGHDQVILHSQDGGTSWSQQHTSPDVFDPQSNSPLLDIYFLDDSVGIAVGAYAVFLRTTDGGLTWEPSSLTLAGAADEDTDSLDDAAAEDEDSNAYDDEFEEFIDYHLNGIAQLSDGSLYLAAERGNAYRSSDRGETWTALELPYGGSMFGALAVSGEQLLTFGLRGNVFSSADQGNTWLQIDTGSLNSLNGAASVGSDVVVMVGVNGEVLVMRDGSIRSSEMADGNDIAAVVSSADGFILVGEGGAWNYSTDDVLNDQ